MNAHNMGDLPELTTATFVGIMIAITGNILISLALNLQKLAHKRVEADARSRKSEEQSKSGQGSRRVEPQSHGNNLDENDEDQEEALVRNTRPENPRVWPTVAAADGNNGETRSPPAVPRDPSHEQAYGAVNGDGIPLRRPQTSPKQRRGFVSKFLPFRQSRKTNINRISEESSLLPVDILTEERAFAARPQAQKRTGSGSSDALEEGHESDYLKSKMWYVVTRT